MAMDVATPRQAPDSFDWNPPAPLSLNLRSHVGKFGIGGDDLIVIEGLPEGAELTAGVCKPDGSWSLRAADVDNAAFIPLYENGETYTLRICLLTPDPSDHGLPKTKGKVQIALAVPLAALPVLEAFEDVTPNQGTAAAAADNVILLPADPALRAIPAAAPQPIATAPQAAAPTSPPAAAVPIATAAPTPAPAPAASPVPATAPAPAADRPQAATPPLDFDKHFAALRTEWQTNVKNQVAAAEKRLKAAHLQQLSKIQTVLAQEEATRTTAISAKWKAEMDRRAADAEAELKARAGEHLVGLEARLRSKSGARVEAAAGSTADFEVRLAAARQQWQAEEAARLAAAEAEWRAEALKQRTAIEARMADSYKERLAAVESAMKAKDGPQPTTVDPTAVERAVAEARAVWEIEEGARRAKDAAELAAAHQRHVAQLEAQYAALHEMRMTTAEAAWRKAEAERLAAAELAWSKREAERLAAGEAKWRTEHDKRLEVVLANLDTMVKGQLGNIDGSRPLPIIEPTLTTPPPPRESQPDAGDGRADERRDAEAAAITDDIRWHKTAAA